MTMTASDLITTALQQTYGMHGRQRISKAALLAELSHQDDQIVQMFAQIAPDLLATITGSASVTLASNTAGYTLSAGIHYRDFTHVDSANDSYVPITLVRRESQDSPPRNPAGMLRLSGSTGVFYPVDPEGTRWQSSGTREWFEETESHVIKYSYVPAATQLTALSSTLTSPDMAREALLSSLKVAILLGNPEVPADRIQVAMVARKDAYDNLRMLAYKFGHPAGTRRGYGEGQQSDAEWVAQQVGS